MNGATVAGLIRRHGNKIGWFHAIPPDPSTIDPVTRQPRASLGVQDLPEGTFGESYPDEPAMVRAYVSNKSMMAMAQAFGNVEIGDLQLDFAVPFAPEPAKGIPPLSKDLEAAYNRGDFAVTVPKLRELSDERETMTYDRFSLNGRTYVAKARPVPIMDRDKTVAWRLFVTEFTIGGMR